jgi:hypothetical protein
MDIPTRNFLKSVRAVSKTLADKPSTTTLPPALVETYGQIGVLYGEARILARRTEPGDRSATVDKEAKLRTACEATRTALAALQALASKQGDTVLYAFSARSLTALARTGDATIIETLEEAIAGVRAHLTELTDYEVTANELDAAEDRIDLADDALGNPRSKVTDRGAAVQQLTAKCTALRKVLNEQFDPLIERLAASPEAPRRDFAAIAARARIIINAGEGGTDPADPTTPPTQPPKG